MLLLIAHLPTGMDVQEMLGQMCINLDKAVSYICNVQLTASDAGKHGSRWCVGLHHELPEFAAIHLIHTT